MTTYNLGDGVELEYRAYVDGELVDATVVLTIVDPGGNSSTPPVTHADVGVYTYVVPTSNPTTDLGPWLWSWNVSGELTDVESGSFFVALAGAPVYSSLAKLKRRKKIAVDDTTDDDNLLDDLETASRMVETKCGGRQFWLAAEVSALEYNWRYNAERLPDRRWLFRTQDFATTTIVVEYDASFGRGAPQWTVVPTSAYEAYREEGEGPETAYVGVAFHRFVSLPFVGCPRMRFSTRWGWPAVPAVVDKASLLIAARYGARDGSPEGVIQSQEWGGVRVNRFDPDVEALLANLKRPEFA